MGPALVTQNATDVLAWAQPWPPRMLQMVLHGPSPGHPECYRRSCMGPVLPPTARYQSYCMGPALATKHATYGIVWAHRWPQSMLRTVLHGPIAGPQSVLPMILHGPSTGHPAYYRWSCVGQHWPQSVLR